MHLSVGEHYIVKLFGMDVHLDTLITLWLAMAIILVFAGLAVVKINLVPNKIQAAFEKIILIFTGLTKDLGKNQGSSALILMCIFLLIIVSNLVGQLPFRLIHLPEGELAAPTNDINTTAALAVFVLAYYIYKGIKAKGLRYFKHYFEPVWFITPFNILEDFTRPLTLALRLFANILAGEIIILVLGSIVASMVIPENASGQNLGLVQNIELFIGSLLPLPMMFFELFVAFIQALVFTLLASAYIRGAVGEEH